MNVVEMAPVNNATSNQASRDRKLRLRVRNGPNGEPLSSAKKVKVSKNDENNKEKVKPIE